MVAVIVFVDFPQDWTLYNHGGGDCVGRLPPRLDII
jgi:hypothetical protein